MKVMFICRGAEYVGVEYLSACLKSKGHAVALAFDPGFDDTFHFKIPFFRGLNRWQHLLRRIKEFTPDILAVSSVSNTYPYLLKFIEEVKKTYRCYTIIGGVHASAIPDYIIGEGMFDAVCVGEGECALVELLHYLEKEENPLSLKNFYFIKDREIIRNPLRPLIEDLDGLPYPDKGLFYKYGAFSTTLTLLSGRGCPFSCYFCVNGQWRDMYKGLGRYIRRYSPERMLDEIQYFIGRYPIKRINFQDDIFSMDRRWLTQFSELYLRLINLPFQCNVHPRFVSDDTVRLLKEAGCVSVCMGVQTAVQEKRSGWLGRGETNEEIQTAVSLLKKYRIPVYLEYIFGLPGETLQDIAENIAFNNKLQPDNTASFVLYPFPGTPLLNNCRESNIINGTNLDKIFKGEGSYHYASLLRLPDNLISETTASLFPLLRRLPNPLSVSIIRLFSYKYLSWLVKVVRLLSLPVNNFFQFRERIDNYFRMFRYTRDIYHRGHRGR